jgi:hypothetical protein
VALIFSACLATNDSMAFSSARCLWQDNYAGWERLLLSLFGCGFAAIGPDAAGVGRGCAEVLLGLDIFADPVK